MIRPFSGPLTEGEPVLLIDGKGRRYLVKLDRSATFGSHRGVIPHSAIIGAEDGSVVATPSGAEFQVLRPRLADYVLKMQRGAQVVYPKDIGPIVLWADIAPGMTVLEAGTGSGALTLGLLRAVGPEGRVVTVERREDHQKQAIKTIKRWFGELPDNLDMRIGEVEEAVAELGPERIVLDLPEPWHVVPEAAAHQPTGAVFASYLPTIPQVQTLVETMRDTGAFAEIEIFETLHRTWNVKGRSVRPSHTMVGHTGFVVTARRVVPSSDQPSAISDQPEERSVSEEE
jgi:tRNA (adenine57-N1/adenine58-N1)-methyltransferase